MLTQNMLLLQGLTVGRVYCTREHREDFERIWTLFFGAVDCATGQEVMYKAFSRDETGIRAILVDGCQAQIDGLGDFLVKRNVPSASGVSESDPQKIVEWIVKICGVHFDRYGLAFLLLSSMIYCSLYLCS